jgi:hypothetical protein
VKKLCSEPGCGRFALAKGLCHAHNMRRWSGWTVAGPIRRIRRLSFPEAEKIRFRYVTRGSTIAEMAEEYGVARVTIWRILRGLTYSRNDGLQEPIDRRAASNEHPEGSRCRASRSRARR